MKDSNDIRTYPSKGLILFLSGVILFGALCIVGTVFLVDNMALKIVLIVFCAIFIVLSLIVLLMEAINYLSLDETNQQLVVHKFIVQKKIPLTKVSRVEVKDQNGQKELHRTGVDVVGANTLIVHLERCGIKIKW